MKIQKPMTDAEWLAREDEEPGVPGRVVIVDGVPVFEPALVPASKHALLKLLLAAAVTVTLILCAASEARAGMADVVAAEQAIEAAKLQRKEAMKSLSKVEKAELGLIKAQRQLDKARGQGGTLDAPATVIKPSRKQVRT